MRFIAGATAALRRLLDVLLITLILVVLAGVVIGKLVPLTGRQTMIIGGPSMEPSIGLGSAIIIGRVAPEDLAVGDVISLQAGPDDAVFTHRIIEVVDARDGRWVRTKGDANDAADPTLVPSSAILGRMEASIPLAGYLLALLSLPTGILFLLGLAATLLAAAWLLESLELEAIESGVVVDVEGPPSRRRPIVEAGFGEPIAARPSAYTFAVEGAFGGALGSRGLPLPDRIAAARQTRRRRDRWQADATRRSGDGNGDGA